MCRRNSAYHLTAWLVEHDAAQTRNRDALKAAAYAHFRALQIEPPTPDRVDRLVRSAMHAVDDQVYAQTLTRLSLGTCERLQALLHPDDSDAVRNESEGLPTGRSPLADLKADPGPLTLATIDGEITKLDRIRRLGLPVDVFAGVAPTHVETYRQRVVAEELHEVQRHPDAVRYTLLAAFCWLRSRELIDTLGALLMDMIHHLGTKAERRVDKILLQDLKRVHAKTNLLFHLAEAAVDHPDGIIREVLYPVVSEKTLRDLVKEHRASGLAYQQQVYTVMRASYRHHYRRMIPRILHALEFHSNNTTYRPVLEALTLLKHYAAQPSTQPFFSKDDIVPMEGVIRPALREVVVKRERDGSEQINRINYELGVLEVVRDKLRCKEVWLAGANRLRNPDDDLPADFDAQRATYYAVLNKPSDADTFILAVQQHMQTALTAFDRQLPTNSYVTISERNDGWITLTPLDPQPEPPHLHRLKRELGHRWSMINLLDMLKETDLRVDFTRHFTTATTHQQLDRATLQRRLLLCIYGLGTNMGLKRVGPGNHGEAYRDLVYTRRRFITRDKLRMAIAEVVNAIFAARLPAIWGEGTTACASDSKKFGAWDQNLMTEWSIRHRGPGIMIYWHVDKKATCVYSQLKTISSSEVAAMITGVLRHCADMVVEKQYVDSHGQSEVAFALCNLLNFQLLPRLKGIHTQRLYRPQGGQPDAFPNPQPILRRPIKWALIHQQYDELIKYATALRLGTAEAEAILRRFTRGAGKHPTYQALMELGKAYKTIFLSQYLNDVGLRREIQEALNVIENWNSANNFIFYGKGSEIATNRHEDQEVTMLCLHLLQLGLVYINTLLIQRLLGEPQWVDRLTPTDYRALTPLIYSHVNPYGLIRLGMTQRIPIDDTEAA